MTFEARVEARGRGHVVALPFGAREAFGVARAPVTVTIRAHSFRTTTMRYGGVGYICLNREAREAAGVSADDTALIDIEPDTGPREVDVPPELARLLTKDATASAAFEKLSHTHRKEYARWIAEAKRDDSRERRLAKTLEMLRSGVRTPG